MEHDNRYSKASVLLFLRNVNFQLFYRLPNPYLDYKKINMDNGKNE